jgi:hypothetical protein
MPIKNYASKSPANQSINKIQEMLVKHGATGVLFEYEQGTGRILALKFILTINGERKIPFSLPVDWRRFQLVLKAQGISKARDDDYCYRVAWANVRDWVDSQLAFLELDMVDLPQLFLPYAMSGEQTLYEKVQDGGLFLESGK